MITSAADLRTALPPSPKKVRNQGSYKVLVAFFRYSGDLIGPLGSPDHSNRQAKCPKHASQGRNRANLGTEPLDLAGCGNGLRTAHPGARARLGILGFRSACMLCTHAYIHMYIVCVYIYIYVYVCAAGLVVFSILHALVSFYSGPAGWASGQSGRDFALDLWSLTYPEGPDTQLPRTQAPKAIIIMVFKP